MKTCFKLIAAVWATTVYVACSTPAKVNYLKDMAEGQDYPVAPAPELIIQPDDCLGILVSSETPELAAPFNLMSRQTEEGQQKHSYVVDSDGEIDFPVLGTLKVAGLSLKQIKEDIANRIRKQGYIQEPIVEVTLDNFTVTVIGKIGNNVLSVKDNSINLLEVIGRSGNITAQSDIRSIMVVRTENGLRRAYNVNLQSADLFNSPAFYLKQHDVVYVKQRGSTLSSEGQITMGLVGSGLTLVNIILTFLLWSNR